MDGGNDREGSAIISRAIGLRARPQREEGDRIIDPARRDAEMAVVGLAELEDEKDRARDRNGAEQLGDHRELVERGTQADAAEDQSRP